MTKKKPKSEHKKVGRPTKMTPEVIEKLEWCFAKGFTDQQASDYVAIDITTLYEHCRNYPEFSHKKEALKSHLIIRSKLLLAESIENGNTTDGKWLLERKAKDEYSLRQETTGKDGEAIKQEITITQEEIRKMADELRRRRDEIQENDKNSECL